MIHLLSSKSACGDHCGKTSQSWEGGCCLIWARQVSGLVGRPERSLEAFAACPAPGSPLVAFLGAEGCVPLVSLRSRQAVGDLKMSGTVRSAAFSADGLELLTSGAPPDWASSRCGSMHGKNPSPPVGVLPLQYLQSISAGAQPVCATAAEEGFCWS